MEVDWTWMGGMVLHEAEKIYIIVLEASPQQRISVHHQSEAFHVLRRLILSNLPLVLSVIHFTALPTRNTNSPLSQRNHSGQ